MTGAAVVTADGAKERVRHRQRNASWALSAMRNFTPIDAE